MSTPQLLTHDVSRFRLLGVGRRAALWKESRPQQVRPLLLGHGVQALVEHLVGEKQRTWVLLISSRLISPHLISSHGLLTRTASYPSILRCRAFRAGPPRRRDVPRQKELGEKSRATLCGKQSRELAQAGVGEKRSGSGSALSLRKCQAARIKISTTTEALFFFHSQHKCFGKRTC